MRNFICVVILIWLNVQKWSSVEGKKLKVINYTSPIPSGEQQTPYNQEQFASVEEKLLRYLFKDYNPHIMPRENLNESFKLYVGLAMSQLINVYDKEQVMKTNVWLHMWWIDPYLQWSHIKEFSHIISIRIPHQDIWTPDIILFNNAHGKYDVSYKSNVVLYQQGGCLWIPPAIYKSSCQINVKYFPFDEQECEMIFGSWVYNSDELTLDYFENMRNVDLNDYVPSGTWGLIGVPASIEYFKDTNTNKTKAQMVYKIKMRRKSRFYIVNIIIPTFLLSFLSVCVFYLPTDDGEKITLSLSILFALVVFFLLIAKIIPPTSIVVPLISKYLLFTFIMNILSVLNTCIVIGLYYKRLSLDQVNPLFRFVFFEVMPRLLLVKNRRKIADRMAQSNASQLKQAKMLKYPSTLSLTNSINQSPIRYVHYMDRSCENLPSSPLMFTSNKSSKLVKSTVDLDNDYRYDEDDPKKYNSYHDLILVSDDARNRHRNAASSSGRQVILRANPCERNDIGATPSSYRTVGRFYEKPRSNLYNLDRLKNSPDLKYNTLEHSKPATNRLEQERYVAKLLKNKPTHTSTSNLERKLANKKDKLKTRLISLETIKLNERFLNVCRSVDYISNIMKSKAELNEIKEDWKYVASLLDRLMLIIFFTVTCVGTFMSFFKAAHLFETIDEHNLIKANSQRLTSP